MNNIIAKIYEELAEQYKLDKNVLGIALFGSVARGKSDEYSDIDIYIILKTKIDYSRKSFLEDGVRVEILFDTVDDAFEFLEEDKYSIHKNTSHMLAHAKILYKASDDLDKIIEIAKNNLEMPAKYSNDEILMHKYSINDFWIDINRNCKNKNTVAFEINSSLLVKNIIELFLKVKGGYLKQPNEMGDYLKSIDSHFGELIAKYCEVIKLDNKIEIMSDIIKYLHKISGGPLPEEWSVK